MTAAECIEAIREVLDRDVKVTQWSSGNERRYPDPDITLRAVDSIVEKFKVYGEEPRR